MMTYEIYRKSDQKMSIFGKKWAKSVVSSKKEPVKVVFDMSFSEKNTHGAPPPEGPSDTLGTLRDTKGTSRFYRAPDYQFPFLVGS